MNQFTARGVNTVYFVLQYMILIIGVLLHLKCILTVVCGSFVLVIFSVYTASGSLCVDSQYMSFHFSRVDLLNRPSGF